jgi:hypothetical protein
MYVCVNVCIFGGNERADFEKHIAPFMNDMLKSGMEVWRRVCDERKYAFVTTDGYKGKVPC